MRFLCNAMRLIQVCYEKFNQKANDMICYALL